MHVHHGAFRLLAVVSIAFHHVKSAAMQRNGQPTYTNLTQDDNGGIIYTISGDDEVIVALKNTTLITVSSGHNKIKPIDWPKRAGEPVSSEDDFFVEKEVYDDNVRDDISEELEVDESLQDPDPEPVIEEPTNPISSGVPIPASFEIPGFPADQPNNEVPATAQLAPSSSAQASDAKGQLEDEEEFHQPTEDSTIIDAQEPPVESQTGTISVDEPLAASVTPLAPEWTVEPSDDSNIQDKNPEYWNPYSEIPGADAIASTKITDAPSMVNSSPPTPETSAAEPQQHREVLEASDADADADESDDSSEEEDDDEENVNLPISPPVASSYSPYSTVPIPGASSLPPPPPPPPAEPDIIQPPEQLQPAQTPDEVPPVSPPPPAPPPPIIEPWIPPTEPHMIPADQPILSAPLPLPPPYIRHPPMPEKQFKSIAYFCNWAIYDRKHFPENMPLDRITHILYAFANVNPDTGEVTLTDPWSDTQCRISTLPTNPNGTPAPASLSGGCFGEFYRLKQQYRHLRILLSVGGWSFSANFARGVDSDEKRAKFATSVVELVNSLALDGVDLDWEYALDPVQAENYVDVCRRTRAELDALAGRLGVPPQSFDLSVAAPGGPEQFQHLNIRAMDQYLSFWNLMTYDFAGSWSSVAAYHSNLYNGDLSAHRTVDAYIQGGVSPDKLVLGFPIYGRSFANTRGIGHPYNGVGKGTWESGVYDYKLLPIEGSHEYVDTQSWSAWCYHEPTQVLITYDNAATVKAKAAYIKHMNLAGAMFWESSADYPVEDPRSIIGTLTNELQLIEKPVNLALEKFIARNETKAAQAAL